jgi:succinate dehydrogenase flavoprotein subunit
MQYHQVVIVGGGLAGMRAAIACNERNIKAAIISKVHPVRSHSVAAQGGINASLGNHPRGSHDNARKHAFDTVKGSDYLADQDAVFAMTSDAPARIYEMEHWGCPFSRTTEGRIAQRPFGGAGFPRTAYAADKTGHALIHTLYEQVVRYEQASERQEMVVYDEWEALSLFVDKEGVCRGVVAMNIATGEVEGFLADAVIFCTGGAGRIYSNTTNALINTGIGMAIPFWAGVPLKDMEFIQFHPTSLVGSNILMTEGCRGAGGFLTNKNGDRFLVNYSDSSNAMEIAPRDIVARNIWTEIQEGRGINGESVHLELMHLGEEVIMKGLPGIREICLKFLGIDPILEPIPVVPSQHYTMGGIDADADCKSPMPGFFAAGEGACVSVHGANRLGGNSLLETIVFGKIAGDSAVEYLEGLAETKVGEKRLKDQVKRDSSMLKDLAGGRGSEEPGDIRAELGKTMKENVGIFREKSMLSDALDKIKELQKRYRQTRKLSSSELRCNFELIDVYELGGMLDVAECIVAGAVTREESRGSQFRTDFPKRDDENWLKHTIANYDPEAVKLSYSEVTLGMFEPKERKY